MVPGHETEDHAYSMSGEGTAEEGLDFYYHFQGVLFPGVGGVSGAPGTTPEMLFLNIYFVGWVLISCATISHFVIVVQYSQL